MKRKLYVCECYKNCSFIGFCIYKKPQILGHMKNQNPYNIINNLVFCKYKEYWYELIPYEK